jgi:hypothetical protein
MKPRVIRTSKILAIAVTTAAVSASPGAVANAEVVAEPAAPAPEAVGAAAPPIEATPAPGQDRAVNVGGSARQAELPPQTPPVDKKELWPLREELFQGTREQAIARVAHFRPLCDKDGYPLVGNVIRKSPGYQPSAFCAEIRKKNAS